MIDELSEDLMFRLEVFQFLLQVQKFFFRHLVISAVLPSLHDRFATLKKLKKLRIKCRQRRCCCRFSPSCNISGSLMNTKPSKKILCFCFSRFHRFLLPTYLDDTAYLIKQWKPFSYFNFVPYWENFTLSIFKISWV